MGCSGSKGVSVRKTPSGQSLRGGSYQDEQKRLHLQQQLAEQSQQLSSQDSDANVMLTMSEEREYIRTLSFCTLEKKLSCEDLLDFIHTENSPVVQKTLNYKKQHKITANFRKSMYAVKLIPWKV